MARELDHLRVCLPLVVIFDGNGATGGTMAPQELTYNVETVLNANAFTRPGYVFTGWNTTADGMGTAYADGESIVEQEGSIRLYAQWEPAYSVENCIVYAAEGAVLIIASYDGGRMTEVHSVTAPAGGWRGVRVTDIARAEGFALPSSFKLMLVDGTSYAPLCQAWTKLGLAPKG
ncbi:MAG: InlB B-repeat-containing protein [Oscillospiraceae bacterium]|nr:InlB B-repeat-containing protein [Oscillospiraceae bacterium]